MTDLRAIALRLRDARRDMAAEAEAAQHRLAGFDRALALLDAPVPAEAAPAPIAALPRPRRAGGGKRRGGAKAKPGKRAPRRPRAEAAAERDALIRRLWGTEPVAGIAAAAGCSNVTVYQAAKRLRLPQRPRAARATRPAAAKPKPAAAEKTEPDPVAMARPSSTVAIARQSSTAGASAIAPAIVARAPAISPGNRPPSAPVAARDVAPGESWAFPDHRSQAAAPPGAALPRRAGEEAAAIAAHIAAKGVTRAADFGVHQPVVDAARGLGMQLFKLKTGYQRPAEWSLNDAGINTRALYERVNGELKRRGRDPVPAPAGALT